MKKFTSSPRRSSRSDRPTLMVPLRGLQRVAVASRPMHQRRLPATGQWRPPFQQAYTVSARGFGNQFHPSTKSGAPTPDRTCRPCPMPAGQAAARDRGQRRAAGGYGNLVVLDHGAGQHLLRPPGLHRPNITLARPCGRAQLGIEGTTGTSTGNHLHFEVRQNGTPIDPSRYARAWAHSTAGRRAVCPGHRTQ